jgi:transposase
VSDELWALIEPLLPQPGPNLVEGRPRVPDRQARCGILFVLHTGIQGEYLPQELGFGSDMTCWRRLVAWNEAGVWDQLHVVLLESCAKNPLDWSRVVIDSSHTRAARRGPKAGPARSAAHGRAASTTSSSTTKASRSRSLTGANRNDVTQLLPLGHNVPAQRRPCPVAPDSVLRVRSAPGGRPNAARTRRPRRRIQLPRRDGAAVATRSMTGLRIAVRR